MPPKPKNTRGKQTRQSRKSKAKQRQGMTAATPETSIKPAEVIESIKVTQVKPTPAAARTQTMEYPYVTDELKRIGILAAIIIAILIILAIVIP